MDICVLNPFFYPYQGGTEKVLLQIYSRLAKHNNISVITSAPKEKNQDYIEEIEGIRVVRKRSYHLTLPGMPLPFLVIMGVKEAIKKADADLYHINNRYQFFYDTVLRIKSMKKKMALTIHNALPKNIDFMTDSLGLFYEKLWGRGLMHNSDLITGVSKNTLDTTVPKRDMKKSHVVYNGVDYNKFKKFEKNDETLGSIKKRLGFDGTTIVTNGRLVTQKGQLYLIKAVAELVVSGYKDLNLIIIGRGKLENYFYKEAERLGISRNFKIVHGIDEDLLPYYYNVGDIFVLPSLYEPAGLAILESMSCELPSIVSSIGGLPEMVDGYGFYMKPKSIDEIKEAIVHVLNNKKEAQALAKAGRELIIKRNDWDKIAKQYEALFLDTIRY